MEPLVKVHVPYGADGEGNYSRYTKSSMTAVENTANDILTSIDVIPFSTGLGGPFVICDFGTADGGASMKLLDLLISRIREKNPKQEILIQYEDQPHNDHNSIFFHTQGIKPVTDIHGEVITPYLSKHEGVFVTCSGTSFFEQCFPSSSVHFSMSFTAMHYLSRLPCHISNGISHTQATPGSPELLEFQNQAKKDWIAILVNRGNELCRGGRFVLLNLCYLPKPNHYKFLDTFNDIWRNMRDEGVINDDEYLNTTIQDYYRNKEEIRQPFNDPNSEVSKLGLRLISVKTQVTPCPFNALWASSECTLPADEYAKLYVRALRGWSNSIFLTALNTKRQVKEREGIVDELFDRYCHCVAAEPGEHAVNKAHHYIVIEKVA